MDHEAPIADAASRVSLGLQYSRQHGPTSALIAWRGGRFSHVDVIMPDGRLLGARSDVIGGMPEGVQIRPEKYADWAEVLRVFKDVTADQEAMFYTFLNRQLGKPYDKIGIVDFIFGMAHDRNWRDETAWFCSELVIAALDYAGIIMELTLDAFKIDPGGASLITSAIGFKA